MSDKLNIVLTNKFKKDLKTYAHKQDILDELDYCIMLIQNHTALPPKYKDHPLTGNWKSKRDCHVRPDDILIYQITDNNLILIRFASHSKLGLTENIQKPLKLHIKETYELLESNRPNVFDNNSRQTYGDLINPNSKVGNVTTHDYYKFEKGKDAILSYMTSDEYINKCIYDIFKSNYDKTVTNSINWDKVDEYAELMKQGTKFPTPYLDYVNAGQEGRHRALAFKQAFGEDAEMPVIELYPSNPTLDEIYEYCTQKWHNGEQWVEYVAPKFGYTTKEIYDYLGKEYIEPEPEEDEVEPDDLDNIDDLLDDEDLIDDDGDMSEFFDFCSKQLNRDINDLDDLSMTEIDKMMKKWLSTL